MDRKGEKGIVMEMERKEGGEGLGTWIDGETGVKEGRKEGRGGEMWWDNITCVKCRRVCAHRNMFNGFYYCREGCVRCVLF